MGYNMEIRLIWKKDYETGNELVDGQHREIFRLVQQVLDMDTFSGRKEKIEAALSFLADYVVRHFSTEEALMNESEYPEMQQHTDEHKYLTNEVVKFMEFYSAEGSKISVSESMNNLVISWLNTHIKGSDKNFAGYYREWLASN
jgi:hemerythrin